jgi:hypothetical protein
VLERGNQLLDERRLARPGVTGKTHYIHRRALPWLIYMLCF